MLFLNFNFFLSFFFYFVYFLFTFKFYTWPLYSHVAAARGRAHREKWSPQTRPARLLTIHACRFLQNNAVTHWAVASRGKRKTLVAKTTPRSTLQRANIVTPFELLHWTKQRTWKYTHPHRKLLYSKQMHVYESLVHISQCIFSKYFRYHRLL